MNSSSFFSRIRSILAREQMPKHKKRLHQMRLMKLEDRRVLNASLALTATELTLSDFDAADVASDGLNIFEGNVSIDGADVDAYIFELDANTWDAVLGEPGDPADLTDGIEINGTQLRVAKSLFESGRASTDLDIVINDSLNVDLDVRLDTSLETFGGDFQATIGGSFLSNAGFLTTTGDEFGEASGDVSVTADGDITFMGNIDTSGLNNDIDSSESNGGNVTLNAVDGNVTTASINAMGGVTADPATVGEGGVVTIVASDADASGDDGDVITNGTIETSTEVGATIVDIDADRNIIVNESVTADGGSADLNADSDSYETGAISQIGGTITAESLSLSASTGIGSASAIQTVAENLQFNNTTGETNISNTGALVIDGASNFGEGGSLSAGSPLTINAAVTSAADILLEAAGDGGANTDVDDLTINASITHTGLAGAAKVITLRADDDVNFASGVVSFANTNAGDTLTVQADSSAVPTPDANLIGDISFNGGTVNVGLGTANFSTNTAVGGGAIIGNVAAGTDVAGGNLIFAARGAIGATNAIETSSGTVNFNSAADVSIVEDDAMVVAGTNTAASLTLTAGAGSITDASDADIAVTNNASFTTLGAAVGDDITIGDEANNADTFGSVTFNSNGIVSISEDNAVVVAGVSTASILTLTAEAGSITDASNADIAVTNNASFTTLGAAAGDVITIGDEANNADTFGSVTFNSNGNVNISEDDAMVVAGANTAADLTLTAEAGSITDASDADITSSTTNLTASGAITLGDEANNADSFGPLTFNSSGNVNISEDDAIVVAGTNTAGSLALTAETGSITDASDADIAVTNNASFTTLGAAAGDVITIGDEANNADTFGSITFNSNGNVNISEDNAMVVAGANTAADLTLTAEAGSITDASDADITASTTNLTATGAGGAINLGDQANNADTFGPLTFNSSGNVSISEDDAIVVTGTNTADSLALTAETQSVTDASDADIAVTNNASFTTLGAAAGDVITIGDEANNADTFGSITFNSSGNVNISEDDAMVVAGASTAADLTLTAETQSITDASNANVAANSTVLTATGAGGAITLGDEANNADTFGPLTFNSSGNVSISEDDAMVVTGTNTAAALALTAETQTITDASDADITATSTNLTANGAGGAITIGDEANNADTFGPLTFNSSGNVNISEDDAIVVAGTNTAGSLALTAETQSITDASDADIAVTNNASFTTLGAAAGDVITIGDEANNVDTFGSVTFNSNRNVNISEDDAMVVAGANTAADLTLTAEAGSITDASDADITASTTNLTATGAGGAINLGNQANNADTFGPLTFNSSGNVSISEDDAIVVTGTNTADSLALTAETQSVTDASDADIAVTNNASFTTLGAAAGDVITIGDEANNADTFGSITFNSSGNVHISEDDAMVVAGASTAADLTLIAETQSITDASNANVAANSTVLTATGAGGAITLGDEANNADTFGPLTFNSSGNVSISEDDAMVVTGTNTAAALALTAETQTITDASDADIAASSTNLTANGAGGAITIGDEANNADTFGPLTFNSSGNVNISEDDAIVVAGTNSAAALSLTAETQSITDASNANIAATSTVLTATGAGGAITLGDEANNADTFGPLTFNSTGDVSISEDDAMVVAGTNTAANLALTAETQSITDASDADITASSTNLTANGAGGTIVLGDEANNADTFGPLTFNSSGNVNISEDDAIVVAGANTAAALTLTAETQSITDASNADIAVTNNASFTTLGAAAGDDITIGDEANNADTFGSITFNSNGIVNISEDNAMVVAGANTAADLALTAEAGSITDASDADIAVTNNASFTTLGAAAGDDITIGDEANNADTFGSITFNSSGNVNISEDDAIVVVGTNTAANLGLTAETQSITDASNADITASSTNLNANGAGGAITLGDEGNNADNFGPLNFNSSGNVSISEDDAMEIVGVNQASSATLVSETDSITDGAGATISTTASPNSGTASGPINLTAQTLVDWNGTLLSAGANGNPVSNGGAITIQAGTGIAVTDIDSSGGDATGGNIAGGDAGAINLDTAAGNITLAGTIDSSGGNGNGTGVSGNGQTFAVSDPVVLEADTVVLTNGTVSGDISFAGTINGTTDGIEDLTLTAGSGDVILAQDVGTATRIGDLRIVSADDVSTAAVTAASVDHNAGTGNALLGGAISTNTVGGIVIATAGDITANGNLIAQDGTSADDTISLVAGGNVTVGAAVTMISTRDEGTFDTATGDTIQIVAGGGTVSLPASAGFEIATDGGIAKKFASQPEDVLAGTAFFFASDDPIASSAALQDLNGDGTQFLATYQLRIGVAGEVNLRFDIDWRDPDQSGFILPDLTFRNEVNSTRYQAFFIEQGSASGAPAELKKIGHVYEQLDFFPFTTNSITTFNADFSVSHHESIQVQGTTINQGGETGIAAPGNLLSSTDDITTGVNPFTFNPFAASDSLSLGVPNGDVDVNISNQDLNFENGLLEVRIPTLFLPPIQREIVAPEPAPAPVAAPEPVDTPPLFVNAAEPIEDVLTSFSTQSEDYFQLRKVGDAGKPVPGFERIDDAIGWKLLQPQRLKQWVSEAQLPSDDGYELWLITTKARDGEDVTFERPVLKFDIFRDQPFPMEEELLDNTPELKLERLDINDLGDIIDAPVPVENVEGESTGVDARNLEQPAFAIPEDEAITQTEATSRTASAAMATLAVASIQKKQRPQVSQHGSLVSQLLKRLSGK